MKRLFRRLGVFIENKHLPVVIVGGLLIVAAIFGAGQLTMASGTETFISTESQTYKDYTRFGQNFGSSAILVLVTADNLEQLLQPDNLQDMETVETRMAQNPRVISAVSPTFFLKQVVAQQGGEPVLPDNPQALQEMVVDESGQVRPELKMAFPDEKHALIAIILRGGLTTDEEKSVNDEVAEVIAEANFNGVEPIISGMPAVMSEIEGLMTTSLRNMFIIAVVLMLLILAVIFSVRGFFAWRWLPLGVVVLGIIYTFGVMGILSISLSMVTMAIFPIVIGLGVDYAIQFHNRYDEEARRGETVAEAVIDAVTHIGPAIGIAIIAASLGFAALFFSPVPMIRDFGLMLIIGVVVCYIAAIFVLLAILYWHDRRAAARAGVNESRANPGKEQVGWVERVLRRLAPWVIRNPALILPIALALTAGGLVADSRIGTVTDETKFISSEVKVIKDIQTLERLAGGIAPLNVLIEAEDVTDPALLRWMEQLEQDLMKKYESTLTGTSSVADLVLQSNGETMPQSSQEVREILGRLPEPIRNNLVSSDYTAANLVITTRGELHDVQELQELTEQLRVDIASPPSGVKVALTGEPVIMTSLFDALTGGRIKMTLIGVAFIFFGLLFVFRLNLRRAFLATLPIGLILGWSSGVMYLAGIEYTPLTATLGALILGIGTEFTILLMMRYYEEREKGEEPGVAMTIAMTKIGRAIIASGLTVIGGFASLLVARQFLILQDFGIVTMIAIAFALISTLVVLPPLIILLDGWCERRKVQRLA